MTYWMRVTDNRILTYTHTISEYEGQPRGRFSVQSRMAHGPTPEGHLSESELQQEHEHFQKIVNAFLYYK